MMKQRIDNFDFMRSITAWIIVIYHFACICNTTPQYANFPLFYTHANGVWGENTSVNIFFMLSGASLYYNHADLNFHNVKKYYFDRFKGIFPMFYIIWMFLFYQKVTTVGSVFYNGNPKYLLLTLFGMDGYLSYRYPNNYYFIGEWFLGALVLLYLLYPVLTWCIKHCKILTTILLGLGSLSMLWLQPHFLIQKERNLIVCMFAFWLGMLFIEYREKLINPWLTAVAGILAFVLIFIKVPVDSFICAQLIAISLFLVFYQIGTYAMKPSPARKFFQYTSRLSYAIFLLQHVVMSQILSLYTSKGLTLSQEWLLLVVTFVFIYVFSEAAIHLNKAVINSKWFQKMQSFFS